MDCRQGRLQPAEGLAPQVAAAFTAASIAAASQTAAAGIVLGPSVGTEAVVAASSSIADTDSVVASSSSIASAGLGLIRDSGNRFDYTDAAIHQGKSFATATSSNAYN